MRYSHTVLQSMHNVFFPGLTIQISIIFFQSYRITVNAHCFFFTVNCSNKNYFLPVVPYYNHCTVFFFSGLTVQISIIFFQCFFFRVFFLPIRIIFFQSKVETRSPPGLVKDDSIRFRACNYPINTLPTFIIEYMCVWFLHMESQRTMANFIM